jgi:hypothetical protein
MKFHSLVSFNLESLYLVNTSFAVQYLNICAFGIVMQTEHHKIQYLWTFLSWYLIIYSCIGAV